jgi:hypothetical protein
MSAVPYVKEDYRRWKQPDRYDFSFCKYPFVYDPASKVRLNLPPLN